MGIRLCSKLSAGFIATLLAFNSAQAAPDIFVDTLAIDYGVVELGTIDRKFVTVYNQGTELLQIFLAIPDPADGSVQEFGPWSMTRSSLMSSCTIAVNAPRCLIKPGGNVQFGIAYTPSYLSSAAASFEITSNDPDSPFISIPLTGTATYAEVGCGLKVENYISQPVTMLDFGLLEIQNKSSKSINLYNNGSTDCNVSDIAVSGSTAFSLDGDGDLATNDPVVSTGPITVSPSSFRTATTIHVTYAPVEMADDTGILDIHSDDNDQPVYPVNLTGSAIDPSVLAGELQIVVPWWLGRIEAVEGDDIIVEVARTNGYSGAISVDYSTSDGTAVSGIDYTPVNGTLTWLDGDATPKSFTIPTTADAQYELVETIGLALSNATGGAVISGTGTETAYIADNTTQDTITFPFSPYITQENNELVVTVRRLGDGVGEAGYTYSATGGGTAEPYVDYFPVSGTLIWPDGDLTDKTILVPIYPDNEIETDETFFIFGYSTNINTAIVDGYASIVIKDSTILDTISYDAASYTVSENGGFVTIALTRSGYGTGDVVFEYATLNGSAVAGSDYISTGGQIWWLDGEVSTKTITIPVLADALFENDEQFFLLGRVSMGSDVLTNPDGVTITITDATVNQAPVVNTGGPYSGLIGSPIVFDGSASYDPNLEALTYFWDLGDGTTASGPVVEHTYSPKRDTTYTVILTVTDEHGVSSSASTSAFVTKPPKSGGGGGGKNK